MSEQIETALNNFQTEAKTFVIVTDDHYNDAGEKLKQANRIAVTIDSTFDPIIKKAHEAHKQALNTKKTFSEPLIVAINRIKETMIGYKKKKDAEAEAERRRLDAIARKEQEEKQIRDAQDLADQGRTQEAEATLDQNVFVAPAVVESAPVVSGISYRETWKVVIENPALVPREYCIPDEKAIGAIARSMKGRVQIPGVEIYVEKTMAVSK